MKRIVFVTVVAVALVSCKEKSAGKAFEVTGKITNNSGDMIFLIHLPVANQQGRVVDSAKVGKDGSYSLKADAAESSIYALNLDRSEYPFASVVNDVKKVTLDVTFQPGDKQYPKQYEVKGSPASSRMKDFIFAFTRQLQEIFYRNQLLEKNDTPDSAIGAIQKELGQLTAATKTLLDTSLQKSNNPALTLFILGYYQSTASLRQYGLPELTDNELKKMVNDLTVQFPEHTGLAGLNRSMSEPAEGDWIGKEAPEIASPDPNGKIIKLSSFRGKYVLVDFWASWCGPCRQENPNVVKAYNKFKDKNFTILGVSLDRPGDKDKWLNAVMKDNLTWTQVSDLMEWNSPVVSTYGFGQEGIPYNILVDPSGKIIAERLTGGELEAKLAEVLK